MGENSIHNHYSFASLLEVVHLTLGEESHSCVPVLTLLGLACAELCEFKAGHDHLSRALRLQEERYGKHDLALAKILFGLALAKENIGDVMGGINTMARAKSIFAEANGENDPDVVEASEVLGRMMSLKDTYVSVYAYSKSKLERNFC